MDNPKYIEALDECCDDPLMVEPLTWDTAIQDWAGTSQQLSERSDSTSVTSMAASDRKSRASVKIIFDVPKQG